MKKIEWKNYIAQSLICTGFLTILILFAKRLPEQRGYANGISTLSVPQNHSGTNANEQRSLAEPLCSGRRFANRMRIAKNPQQLCSNIPAAKLVTRTELFFGLRKPNGKEVNNVEFQQFLNREVTPRFPDGFTVISGQGQFKDTRGSILQERFSKGEATPTKLLILLYPIAVSSNQQIEQIRTAYIKAFQQQSVLRADNLSCAAF